MKRIEIAPWATILALCDFALAGKDRKGVRSRLRVTLYDYILRAGLPFADRIDHKLMWKTMDEVLKTTGVKSRKM